MVDEREDRYEGEEGEYHFSDDQVNYEEVETPKSAPTEGAKKSIFEKFSGLSPSRRMLLAGVVFISLIGIVYKMILPPSPAMPTEISQIPTKTPLPPVATTKPVLPGTQPTSSIPSQVAPAVQPTPATSPVASVPPVPQASQTGMQQPPVIQAAATNPLEVPQSSPQPNNTSVVLPPLTTAPPPSLPANVAERVKAVEDHNTAIMNMLQTEYAQKMSEFEMQSNLVRGKMDEMAKRVSRIESSLNQITQMLQQQSGTSANKASPMDAASIIPARSSMPRVIYTVQAIIPGRAWLKADSGDTVTVAEGDVLRDYGRITKIDPYDGVVEIDTGNKVIALSYGMSAE